MDKKASFWNIALDLLFPRNMEEIIADRLTVSDLEKLIGKHSSIYYADCIAPLPYNHRYVRSAIYAMKYYGHKKIPYVLAHAVASTISEELAELRLFNTFTETVLVPIPLHESRLKERGFNQSERICVALQEILDDTSVHIDTSILSRKKKTLPQAKHATRELRIKNMRNAFAVENPERIKNKDIFLVDDVITTGTTLKEARRTLLQHGARHVLCIAVAH